MNGIRVGWGFYAVLAGAALFSFLVHEGAHWAMGTALGYPMVMSLNHVHLASGSYATPLHGQLVTAAGPAITIAQALLAFALIRLKGFRFAYPFLVLACFMRALAALVSLAHPNDEARLSLQWGLGQWTLPLLVVLGLFVLTWLGSRRLQLGWRVNLPSYLLASLCITLIVGTDAGWLR